MSARASLKLSRGQRAAIFAGQAPQITGIENQCPVDVGHVEHLSSRVSLEVLKVNRRRRGGWSIQYQVVDRRDPVRKLRRTPGVENVEALRKTFDEHGYPRELTPGEVADAAGESSYTAMPTSLSDAGEAVRSDVQERFTKEAMTHDELRAQKRREMWEREQGAQRIEQRLREERDRAELLGTDVHRETAAIRRMVQRMRSKNDRRAA